MARGRGGTSSGVSFGSASAFRGVGVVLVTGEGAEVLADEDTDKVFPQQRFWLCVPSPPY